MCRPTPCKTCGKTTWAGCGRHIEQVRHRVPVDRWCDGDHPSTPGAPSTPGQGGFLARLFGH